MSSGVEQSQTEWVRAKDWQVVGGGGEINFFLFQTSERTKLQTTEVWLVPYGNILQVQNTCLPETDFTETNLLLPSVKVASVRVFETILFCFLSAFWSSKMNSFPLLHVFLNCIFFFLTKCFKYLWTLLVLSGGL